MDELKWVSLLGKFELARNAFIFKGQPIPYANQVGPSIGNFLCNRRFFGGVIESDLLFSKIDAYTACELIMFYNPATKAFVTAGIGGAGALYSIRHFFNEWTIIGATGDKANLQPDVTYHIKATLCGSRISLNVDGVDVLEAPLPVLLPPSQVGIWAMSDASITVSNFSVSSDIPRVFVVMEFTSPYNEIYLEVIHKICTELGIKALRSDDTYGPGVIIQDIVRQIFEAKAVIAEITPANPNVYYEVGYAHALNKPTILIADKGTKLPFDVSPFRVLFYENTIPGKTQFEAGLRKHLCAIFGLINIQTGK